MPENEYRYTQRFAVRQDEYRDGRLVVMGTIIRYGDVATFPWGTEESSRQAHSATWRAKT